MCVNMWNKMVWINSLIVVIFVTLCCDTGYCQNNTGSVVSDSDGKNKEPIDEAMAPLYAMTNTFLQVIQPESKGNKILDVLATSLSDTNDLTSQATQNWQEYAVHYLGYVICAAIGIVFFITLPIIGLCFCCCRCCGNCGGKASDMKSRHDKCLRITCGILFSIVNIMILAGMICAFVSNELLRQQTSQENHALMPTLISNLQSLENFKDTTITEIRREVLGSTTNEINNIITSLATMPDNAKSNVSAVTKATGALTEARQLALRTRRINESLYSYEQIRSQLIQDRTALETKLSQFKTTATLNLNALSSCNSDCQSLKTDVNSLQSLNYSVLPQVTTQINGVANVLNGDLEGKIKVGEDELNKIKNEVHNKSKGDVDASEKSLNELNTNVQSKVDDFEKQLKDQVSLNATIVTMTDYQSYVDEYGDYRFYAGIGLSCVLLLILLFNLLGLAFGVCGETPHEYAGTCNRGVGANLLMAGVGFTFIFASLLMLVVLVLFLVGGLLQTEGCRILVDTENSQLVKSMDDLINDRVFKNGSFHFKISEVLSECKEDRSLYKVLNLDNVVNLTDILDLNKYNITSEINKLKQINFALPDLNIYTTDMERALNDLKLARLDDIDFVAINAELNKAIVTPGLNALITRFNTLANTLSGTDKQNMLNRVSDLQTISNTELARATTTKDALSAETANLETLIKGTGNLGTFSNQMSTLNNTLTTAEQNLRSNAVGAVTSFVADEAIAIVNSLTVYLNNLANDLQNDIGKCRAVYTSIDTSIIAVCESTLMPFNGFWFSVGWCLLFLIPSIIFAVKLAGLYRKSEDYQESYNQKGFDDPRNMRNNYDGKHNTGYQRDDYTASRSANYRADSQPYPASSYDPGYNQQGYGGGGGGGGGRSYPSAPSGTPPNPPHYYNNHSNRRFDY